VQIELVGGGDRLGLGILGILREPLQPVLRLVELEPHPVRHARDDRALPRDSRFRAICMASLRSARRRRPPMLGSAIASRRPRIASTARISISVKPRRCRVTT